MACLNVKDRHLPSFVLSVLSKHTLWAPYQMDKFKGLKKFSICHASLVYFVLNLKCAHLFLCVLPPFVSVPVSSADLKTESTQVAFAVLIPVTLLLTLIIGIYLYFSK